jgi:integrase
LLRVRDASERLETLYARLRRCRHLCSGKPLIEKHTIDGRHDCGVVKCQVHVCKPYAASSIRQIHAILSGGLCRSSSRQNHRLPYAAADYG